MSDSVAPANPVQEQRPTSKGWLAELRATFMLAWPLVIAQVAQNALQATDVIMMGWLGPEALAAGTLANSFMMPLFLFGVGVVGAVAPLTAQARGARDIKAIRRVVRQGFWAAIVLAAILIPVVLQFGTVYRALGQDPALVARAEEYIQIAVLLLAPAMGVIVLRSLLSSFEGTRIILLITVGGVIFNAIGNYLLMFGHFGLPRLELRGAAIATVLTNIFMLAVMLTYVLRHRRFRRFHILLRFWKPDWARFREIFRIGTPIGLTVLAEVSLFAAAAILMGRLGTDELAAHAVALQCASLAFMVPLGLGIAATVRVGIAYGRRDAEGIRKAGWTSFMLGTAFMTVSALTFILLGPTIVSVFLDPLLPENQTALALAATYLVIAGLFQLVDGAQVVAAHALRGLSDTKIPMLMAIFGYWMVGMPVAYVMGFVFDMRGVGIWLGLAAGLAFVAALLVGRFAMRERLGLLRAIG